MPPTLGVGVLETLQQSIKDAEDVLDEHAKILRKLKSDFDMFKSSQEIFNENIQKTLDKIAPVAQQKGRFTVLPKGEDIQTTLEKLASAPPTAPVPKPPSPPTVQKGRFTVTTAPHGGKSKKNRSKK